jgi:Clp amino terminal domain, pathogenicity island component
MRFTPPLQTAFSEAARLGHQWVGPEHVVLAILDDGCPSIARSVLNDLGLTHDVSEERFLASDPNSVLGALAQHGIAVPVHPVPRDDPESARQIINVPIDMLPVVRGRLLEAGLLIGFNIHGENGQAWVVVDANNLEASRLAQSLNSN